jgi:ABC-2 type transport system ATP-binding protein
MNAIEVKNLVKSFGKVAAVDGISFEVKKGEVFGFLGPNGAGKTTVIRCMMDFIRPDEGMITILGKDSLKESVKLKSKIGYLSGNVRLYDNWTGRDHINFVRGLNGKKDKADKLCEKLDFDASRKAKTLSSGNRQKLGLILTLMFAPEVLIFDEPTNALDPILQNVVYELIKELASHGATVFMSSHNLAEVERICDRAGIINKGKMEAVEDIVILKEKKVYTVKIWFKGKFNKSEFDFDGVSIEKKSEHGLVLKVKGEISELLKRLTKYDLKDLEIIRASLEDVFLEFYK